MMNRRLEKAAFLCLVVVLISAGFYSGEVQAAIPDYNCALQTAIPEDQCLALVSIYESTDGVNWTVNTNWLESDDPCNWHGVSCIDGSVVALDLFNNNLQGELPLEIGALQDLTTLTVNNNPLEGPVPQTVTLLDLRLFHFHNTGLCEPADPVFQDWLYGVVYRYSNGELCTPLAPTATLPPSGPTSTSDVDPTSTSDLPWPQQTLTAMAVMAATELAETPEASPTPTKYYSLASPTPEPTDEPLIVTDEPGEMDGEDGADTQGNGLLSGIPQSWLWLLMIPLALIVIGLLLEVRERRKEAEPFDEDDDVSEALFKLDYTESPDDN